MRIYDNAVQLGVIEAATRVNLPVLLRGETGTGKTTMVKFLAEKHKKEVTRINLTGQTTREDLVGKYILTEGNTVWQDGILLTALKLGHWILLDEINAALPEVLFVLQALLESQEEKLGNLLLVEKNGELIHPHVDCRIFATCNPSDYDGVKDLNMATLSRFVVVDIHPLSLPDEEALLIERHKSRLARVLAVGAAEARKKKREGETNVFVSTRDLELTAKLFNQGVPEDVAFMTGILSKCQTQMDRDVIQRCFNLAIPSVAPKPFLEEITELKAANTQLQDKLNKLEEFSKLLKDVSSKLTKLT